MKTIFTFIFLLFIPISIYAQTVTIEMRKDGGVYCVPCKINGLKQEFVFDTGASNISLSKELSNYLIHYGYIDETDMLGKRNFVDATGRTTTATILNIKDVEIGGLHLKNVQALIAPTQNAPLLLGQSAIQKLGNVSISGNILTINPNRELDYLPDEMNINIFKCRYGMSYDDVKDILERKYGEDDICTGNTMNGCDVITVENIYLQNFDFDKIDFIFDNESVLCGVELSRYFKINEKTALLKFMNSLFSFYSKKYQKYIKKQLYKGKYFYCGLGYKYRDDPKFYPILIHETIETLIDEYPHKAPVKTKRRSLTISYWYNSIQDAYSKNKQEDEY